MKSPNWSWYTPVLASAVLLIVPSAWAEQGTGGAPAIVTHSCSGCHGVDGNSQLPYIPRLAGLNAAYVEHKLASFRAAASPPVDERSEERRLGKEGTPAG